MSTSAEPEPLSEERLAERLRLGQISPERIALAAIVGHEPARALMPPLELGVEILSGKITAVCAADESSAGTRGLELEARRLIVRESGEPVTLWRGLARVNLEPSEHTLRPGDFVSRGEWGWIALGGTCAENVDAFDAWSKLASLGPVKAEPSHAAVIGGWITRRAIGCVGGELGPGATREEKNENAHIPRFVAAFTRAFLRPLAASEAELEILDKLCDDIEHYHEAGVDLSMHFAWSKRKLQGTHLESLIEQLANVVAYRFVHTEGEKMTIARWGDVAAGSDAAAVAVLGVWVETLLQLRMAKDPPVGGGARLDELLALLKEVLVPWALGTRSDAGLRPSKIAPRVFLTGEGPERTIEVWGGAQLGRDPACPISLEARGVSRKHLTFEREGDRFFVVDHDTTNGTWVDHQKISKRAEIHHGSEIAIGKIRLVFRIH